MNEDSHRPTDTTQRSPEVEITDPALLAQTLLDDLENGNLPGSPIRYRGVWEPKTDTTEETPNHG